MMDLPEQMGRVHTDQAPAFGLKRLRQTFHELIFLLGH